MSDAKRFAAGLLLCTSLIGCSLAGSLADQSSRRPLSDCARGLVERGYLREDQTEKADTYCREYSPAQLADAQRAVDAKQAATFPDALAFIKRAPPEPEPAPVVVAATPEPAPAPAPEPTPEPAPAPAPPPEPTPAVPADILTVAAAYEDLSTFISLLNEAGMTELISQPGPYTVLAPTNAALAKFPYLAKNKERLKKVLSVHIIEGDVSTTDAPEAPAKPKRLTTLGGKWFPMRAKAGVVSIGRAKVVRADVAAANGSIEVIDAVLMP